MKSSIFFILLILLAVAHEVKPQVTQDWVARYDGSASSFDKASAIAVSSSQNIYVTGYSDQTGPNRDIATIKYNSSGTEQWVALYNGTGNGYDWGVAIVVDGSENIYIAGRSEGSGTLWDIVTIKYNSSGTQQWVARYDKPSPLPGVTYSDYGVDLAVDGSGNVYVTGYSFDGSNYRVSTIKYNSSGTQQWDADQDGVPFDLTIDANGNLYIAGWTRAGGNGQNYITIKYNSSGVQQWANTYNGTSNDDDYATGLAVDGNGNVYVTGSANDTISSGCHNDITTIKYNSSGAQQWLQTFDNNHSCDIPFGGLVIDGSSNVYVAGGSGGDYVTLKYNSSGTQQWVAYYDGNSLYDVAWSIAIDGSGNTYVTGSVDLSTTDADYATVKYNSSGTQQWAIRYDGPGNLVDEAFKIALYEGAGITNAYVYITGRSKGNGTNFDYATIEYSQSDGDKPFSLKKNIKERNSNFILFDSYPNPFNPKTNISFSLPEATYVTLKIFDMSGKEIAKLIDEYKQGGIYTVTFDGTNFASGIYFYKLFTEKYTDKKKMILLK